MFTFGILCLIFGIAIIFNPALLGFLVGIILLILGSWIIIGWYKVNTILEKKYNLGKYQIIFQKKSGQHHTSKSEEKHG